MEKALLILLEVLAFSVLESCLSKSNIDIELPAQQRDIVVECYLTPGFPAQLTLTESNTLDGELSIRTLAKAQAFIQTNAGSIQMHDVGYKVSERSAVVNYSGQDTIISDQTAFNLYITTSNGAKLQAATSNVSPIQIQDINMDNNKIIVSHDLELNIDKYFKLVVSAFKQGKFKETKFELYHQKGSIPDPCTLLWEDLKSNADSLVVTLFHIQKEYYAYLNSVRNASSAFRDPFLTPEVIKSNINGGLGIFTYYTFDRRDVSL